MNVNATQAEVAALCTTLGVLLTASEPLLPTGTRVVCQTSEGALKLRGKLKSKILQGEVTRVARSVRASRF